MWQLFISDSQKPIYYQFHNFHVNLRGRYRRDINVKFRHSKWFSLVFIFILAAQTLAAGSALAAEEISKLVLNKNELALQVGDTANLTATAIFVSGATENATVKTDWNSGTPDVASVYAGVVTAKKEGK